ncbi:unnamed protein product [Orchesella dallaii]|uniref:Uncharacterized protein n=1 Tax=Orchesella dallaii TaxID=48710 RepID=A0ABP1RVI9_9HEXA
MAKWSLIIKLILVVAWREFTMVEAYIKLSIKGLYKAVQSSEHFQPSNKYFEYPEVENSTPSLPRKGPKSTMAKFTLILTLIFVSTWNEFLLLQVQGQVQQTCPVIDALCSLPVGANKLYCPTPDVYTTFKCCPASPPTEVTKGLCKCCKPNETNCNNCKFPTTVPNTMP